VNGWRLAWTFANGQTVTEIWNASVSQSGAAVTMTSLSWNATLAPGASANFGFIGTWSATNAVPTGFSLNGLACAAV
jgi:cellulase/cellobiase CelA1